MYRHVPKKPWLAAVAMALGWLVTMPADAASDAPDCATGGCGWSLSVDNVEVSAGSFAESATGGLYLPGSSPQMFNLGGGSFVSISSISGDIDPTLGFSFRAGTGSVGQTFSFSFSLPIALSGAIDANSSVSYSLTSLSGSGAQITPLFGHLIVASEVDSAVGGLPPLNKGVDVGDTFGFVGGPQTQNSRIFLASNSFVGNANYDLMSVVATFSLSPNSQVAVSGFVQQVMPVPEPGGASLALAGLLVVGITRFRPLPKRRRGAGA